MSQLNSQDKALTLSSSELGRISHCECCGSYHMVLGNLTLRMEKKHLISLTQMIIDALERTGSLNEPGHLKN